MAANQRVLEYKRCGIGGQMITNNKNMRAVCTIPVLAGAILVNACRENTSPEIGAISQMNEAQGSFVFPDERPFYALAQEVPTSAGFYLDTASGNVIVPVTNLADAERAKSLLRASLAAKLNRIRAHKPSADVVAQ